MLKGKQGKRGPNGFWVFIALVAVIVLILTSGALTNWWGLQTVSPDGGAGGGSGGGGTNLPAGCNYQPVISLSGYNAQATGTPVTVTPQYRVNSVYKGYTYTTPGLNDNVELLVNSTGYLTNLLDPIQVKCGTNVVEAAMDNYANATVTIYNHQGTAILARATANETAWTTGESRTFKMLFQGTSKHSTGTILYILEIGSNTNVSDATLSFNGAEIPEVNVPKGYVSQLTDGFKKAWEIPAVKSAAQPEYKLNVQADDASIIDTSIVYNTFYGEQSYVDSKSGLFLAAGAFDTANAAVYHDHYHYNFDID
jgi:hypothetical protein